jgi:hypothetical protein
MPRFVNVPLRPETADALRALARQELRDPRLQAQHLLESGLRQAGVLAERETKTAAPETATA